MQAHAAVSPRTPRGVASVAAVAEPVVQKLDLGPVDRRRHDDEALAELLERQLHVQAIQLGL